MYRNKIVINCRPFEGVFWGGGQGGRGLAGGGNWWGGEGDLGGVGVVEIWWGGIGGWVGVGVTGFIGRILINGTNSQWGWGWGKDV